MSHWICHVANCQQPSLVQHYQSDCPLCWNRFCGDHYEDPQAHSCWPYETGGIESGEEIDPDNDEMFSNLNMDKFISEATTLRPGHSCTGPPQPFKALKDEPNIMAGGLNGHFVLTFDDGLEWIVRMRQKTRTTGTSPEAARINLRSDAATCVALHTAGLPVPMAWMRPEGADKTDDLHYFFMERIIGKPCVRLYTKLNHPYTEEIYHRVTEIAKFNLSLEKLTFPKVGGLTFDDDGQIVVGPRVVGSHPLPHPPWYLGPFNTAKEYYLAEIDAILTGCLNGTVYRPSKVISGYVTALEIRELVNGCKEMEEGPWFIAHGDARGDHFRFDPSGQIAGVIDWERAYISCKADAFQPPHWNIIGEFHEGKNDTLVVLEQLLARCYVEFGRPDLAELIPKGRKYQWMNHFFGSANLQPWTLDAMRRSFLGLPDGVDPHWAEIENKWKERFRSQLEKYKGDKGLQTLLAKYTWDPLDR